MADLDLRCHCGAEFAVAQREGHWTGQPEQEATNLGWSVDPPACPAHHPWLPRPPARIQLRRTKGWRKPEGAVSVARPTRWGNPFTVVNGHRQGWLVYDDSDRLGWTDKVTSDGYLKSFPSRELAAAYAVGRFRWHARTRLLIPGPDGRVSTVTALRGADLACWCPAHLPCHADALLELVNR